MLEIRRNIIWVSQASPKIPHRHHNDGSLGSSHPGRIAITLDTTADRNVGIANGRIGGSSQSGSCGGISDDVT